MIQKFFLPINDDNFLKMYLLVSVNMINDTKKNSKQQNSL